MTTLVLASALAAAALAGGPASLAATPNAARDGSAGACALDLDPASVRVGDDRVRIEATTSESIGSLVDADIDTRSDADLEVADAGLGGGTVTLILDLGHATSGTWDVTFHGLHGDCVGAIAIKEDYTR